MRVAHLGRTLGALPRLPWSAARPLAVLLMSAPHPPPRGAASAAASLVDILAREMDREERRAKALETQRANAAKADELSRFGALVTANLYRIPPDAPSATVEDWEAGGKEVTLTFDLGTYGSAREQAEAAFAKARRLRRGGEVTGALLEGSAAASAALRAWCDRAAACTGDSDAEALRAEVAATFKRRVKRKAPDELLRPLSAPDAEIVDPSDSSAAAPAAPAKPKGWGGRVFESPNGVPILVGRNRRENEQLSLKVHLGEISAALTEGFAAMPSRRYLAGGAQRRRLDART